MLRFFILFLCLLMFSCYKTDVVQSQTANTDPATFANGQQLPTARRSYLKHCGAAKSCKFLLKYDDTFWEDTENYYGAFSDIRFSNYAQYFISFFNIDNDVSYCNGWKAGENSADGKRWNIKFKKDEEDILSFDYDYFGNGDEIEYSITYTYEVINGLLHFSSTDGQTFIFSPSDKKYLKGSIDTGEIFQLEGCTFL